MARLFRSLIFACCIAIAMGALPNLPDPELLEKVDPQCLIAGSNILTFCAKELDKGREFFGAEIGSPEFKNLNISDDSIDELLEFLGEVSPECCKVSCELQNQFCGCGEPMEAVITSFAGSMDLFRQISDAFGSETKCNIPIYLQENCPKNDMQRKWKKFSKKGDCSVFME